MARNHRVNSHSPVILREMNIGVADTSVINFDGYIVGPRFPAVETKRCDA